MADDAERLNEITARFRDAGFELRFYESMPGAWDAIWHRHFSASGIGRTDAEKRADEKRKYSEKKAEAILNDARKKAEIQSEVDVAIAKADAEIAARAAEGEAKIAEIREGAATAVKEVAEDTAKAVVAAMGVDVDEAAIKSAIASRLKG